MSTALHEPAVFIDTTCLRITLMELPRVLSVRVFIDDDFFYFMCFMTRILLAPFSQHTFLGSLRLLSLSSLL